jgi:hypothetical protein
MSKDWVEGRRRWRDEGNPSPPERKASQMEQIPDPAERNPNQNPSIPSSD